MPSTSSPRSPTPNPSSKDRPAGGAPQQPPPQQTASANYGNSPMAMNAPLDHGHAHTVDHNVQTQFDPRLPAQYRKHVRGITITPIEHRSPVPYDCPFLPSDSPGDCPRLLYTGAEVLTHAKAVHERDQVSLILWALMAQRMYSADLSKLQDWLASRPAGSYF